MPDGHPPALPTWARLAQPLPLLAAVALFLLWAGSAGGYFPHVWYGGGIFLAAGLVVALFGWPGLFAGIGRPTAVALLALAGFTVWSYLSIGWADVKGDAWDGAGRTALYLIVFTLFALWRVPVSGALVLLGTFALGVSLLGFLTVAAAGRAEDAGGYFIRGRFIDPIGYVNGDAALFVLAFWPALFLASRRELPTYLRPLFLAAAGVLLQLALLPQSRGAVFAFPLVLLVYLALVPAGCGRQSSRSRSGSCSQPSIRGCSISATTRPGPSSRQARARWRRPWPYRRPCSPPWEPALRSSTVESSSPLHCAGSPNARLRSWRERLS